ncbi:uncharacterized protein LOC131689287 isoform X1 [Topomyia yanbarensis]|uniref:uncharacterized protein LOC131689287 isoform X1 n=1 Tax=Topomyia yanbarensis TaxID=2498891 RepID=UPI00273CA4FD|nr:uncharacterized protein LOC131689287 isoform X1 [Topomyia yanbarensis]XP_058830251.1 uncharacterized protein LOC131689287 isoform X1 [Topomyia yanbarensis]
MEHCMITTSKENMTVKLLILAVVGLGSLYVMHLLAQDFMKLSKPLFMASGKRETTTINRTSVLNNFEQKIDWNSILKRDPLKCSLSLICQLAAGAEPKNTAANAIYEFIFYSIENNKNVPKRIEQSFSRGLSFNKFNGTDSKNCFAHYPLCFYSANTMMKLLDLHAKIFGT